MGDFDKSVGVLLIGLFFNTYLYGLVTYQFLVYANTKFNDPLWIKSIVGTLFVTDTIHSAVAVYAAWETCVTNYNNPSSLAIISWTIPFTAVATSVAAIFTQFFLGHRVYILTGSKPMVGLIGVLSTLGFIFGVYAGVRSGIIKEVAKFAPLKPFVICWLGFQTSADLAITFILSFVLSRSRTGFRKTDTIINRLIRGAVQTGLFASIFALADLFTFVLHPGTNLYAMFAYPIGRIYTNTLLDTLNARSDLKKNMSSTMDADTESNAVNTFRMQTQSQTMAGQTLHSIHVQKETITEISPEERSVEKYTEDDLYGHKMA
ncbi:hypothetical protein D9615_001200 [Tricholomella constricta]|uniref:DUF6534 domain-containing protein n=1 Tax=Tricholomella constricta TaxID=117010 RepID=A0A8H5HKT1_9AGAR|nr:hypothetical protein D9615_001200 [Tricholomella constricta]